MSRQTFNPKAVTARLEKPYLLVAVGVGLACYGLFALAWARHIDR